MFRACTGFLALVFATVEVTGAKHKLTAPSTTEPDISTVMSVLMNIAAEIDDIDRDVEALSFAYTVVHAELKHLDQSDRNGDEHSKGVRSAQWINGEWTRSGERKYALEEKWQQLEGRMQNGGIDPQQVKELKDEGRYCLMRGAVLIEFREGAIGRLQTPLRVKMEEQDYEITELICRVEEVNGVLMSWWQTKTDLTLEPKKSVRVNFNFREATKESDGKWSHTTPRTVTYSYVEDGKLVRENAKLVY